MQVASRRPPSRSPTHEAGRESVALLLLKCRVRLRPPAHVAALGLLFCFLTLTVCVVCLPRLIPPHFLGCPLLFISCLYFIKFFFSCSPFVSLTHNVCLSLFVSCLPLPSPSSFRSSLPLHPSLSTSSPSPSSPPLLFPLSSLGCLPLESRAEEFAQWRPN